MKKHKINILDCTLRDGSYQNNFQFTKKDNYKISKFLSDSGLNFIEIGHGLGLGAYRNKNFTSFETDKTYIETSLISKNKNFGVFFLPEFGNTNDIKKAVNLGINFVRVGTEINDFKKTRKYLDQIKNCGAFSCLNLMKTYSADTYEITKISKIVEKWGNVDVLYVVDSAGCMTPNEVTKYIKSIKENTNLEVGFHGHNNLGLANSNSISAVEAGATYIDSSVKGLGRSAGNAQTEILAFILSKMDLIDEINFFELMDLGEIYINNIMPNFNSLNSIDIMLGISRIHSSFMPLFQRSSSDYNINIYKLIYETSIQKPKMITQKNINIIAKELSRIEE